MDNAETVLNIQHGLHPLPFHAIQGMFRPSLGQTSNSCIDIIGRSLLVCFQPMAFSWGIASTAYDEQYDYGQAPSRVLQHARTSTQASTCGLVRGCQESLFPNRARKEAARFDYARPDVHAGISLRPC